MKIYLIGSLRNPKIPELGNKLRSLGYEVFDDWYAAGPEADDYWQKYEKQRGRTYEEAMQGKAVKNVVQFDKHNLEECDVAILVMPAGKSGHLELGYCKGMGKKAYVLFTEEPERWDAMYGLTDGVFFSLDKLLLRLYE